MRKISLFFALFCLVTFCSLHHSIAKDSLEISSKERPVKVWTKDPFMPPRRAIKAVPVAKLPRLSVILYSAERSSAVIDGERVQVGDAVSGYKVLDIKRTSVILQAGSKKQELKIEQ